MKNILISFFIFCLFITNASAGCIKGDCVNGQGTYAEDKNIKGQDVETTGRVTYTGGFKNGKADGKGNFVWKYKTIENKFSSDNKVEYIGYFKTGRAHGKGIATYSGMDASIKYLTFKYIGEFKNGKADGYGKWSMPSLKAKYEGQFKNAMAHGHGTFSCDLPTLSDQCKHIEGEFKNGHHIGSDCTFGCIFVANIWSIPLDLEETTNDLTGIWNVNDGGAKAGTIRISQEDQKIEAVWDAPRPWLTKKSGFNPGDPALTGTLEDNSLTGKIHIHFPLNLKSRCPDKWDLPVDLELTLSDDGNTLTGQRKSFVLESKNNNCRLVDKGWGKIVLTRYLAKLQNKPAVSEKYGWGDKPEEFGLQDEKELETLGPHTFALDRQGNIHIIDTIKGQIKRLDNREKFMDNTDFSGWGSDIAIGNKGEMLALDDAGIVDLSSSNPPKRYEISKEIPDVEGYAQGMRFEDKGNLYICKNQQCYQIGDKNGIFPPEKQTENIIPGFPIRDNRSIRTQWKNSHEAEIEIMDEDNAVVKEIPMKTDDSFGSVIFHYQDDAGFLYIEVERITDDNYVHLEIWKYDETGELASVTELPNDYYSTVYKKLEIDSEGRIHQMLTTSEGVELLIWEPR